MEVIKAFFLGIIQGFAEFLPISSSGHLVIFSQLFDYQNAGLMMNIFVHFGTLLAIFVVFREDIKNMILSLPGIFGFISGGANVKSEKDEAGALAFYIIIGSIPAAIVGLTFKDYFESLSNTVTPTCLALLATSAFLWSSKYPKENENLNFMTAVQAMMIGCAQAFAIMPGISRSGATIVLALWLGLNKGLAARFSFLLSIPVVAGASLLEIIRVIKDGASLPEGQWVELLVGVTAAVVSGYIAIKWMLKLINNNKFSYFAIYCALVGGGILTLSVLKPEWFN
ncbi:MAG: undecaprenyl-diphosphate phosphatase [Lentisphaerales bacterium]|nr:undecaprenyl-diphosphate phosphatase [Lentisphaerales bacterium]